MNLMTEEQMDQFEDDMIMEDIRQSINEEKLEEYVKYYDIEEKFEDILEDKYEQISLFDNC